MAENIVFAPPRSSLGHESDDQPSFRSLPVTALPTLQQAAYPDSGADGEDQGSSAARVALPEGSHGCGRDTAIGQVAAVLEKREQEIARRLAALEAANQDSPAGASTPTPKPTLSGREASQGRAEPSAGAGEAPGCHFPAFAAPRLRQEKIDWEVPQSILDRLALAYDEDPQAARRTPQQSRFAWTGVVDAARAAWIGGTQLLQYGELLPAGTEKALAVMAPGLHFLPLGTPGRSHEVALELGMGRGRVALHLFLAGATVLGVELAWQRFALATEAAERLGHRCPDSFSVSYLDAKFRLVRVGGPQHAFLEARHGDFLKLVTPEEVAAATLIFLHVCLPAASWPSLRQFLQRCQPGCRVLSYEDLRIIWKGEKGDFPFQDIAAPALACSWAPEVGHRFFCYQRRDLEEEVIPLARSGVG
ncbi:unnamed protein product [Symbiodinium natans]|uniref:Uncharacterized protein n=1 Tax=Symbiodinium natans TaxID=878477 RepID=A0A812UQL9_9DINO|nr:unnamed protein product [Symbiodinium natans]